MLCLSKAELVKGRPNASAASDRKADRARLPDRAGSCRGADFVLEPFQDAADRAVDILCGGKLEERTDFPAIETEEKQPA